MFFSFVEISSLPKLSWCAVITKRKQVVKVYHGSWVEVSNERFYEGAWDGDLQGDFTSSFTFAGSGGVIKEESVLFSTPTHILHRLHSTRSGHKVYISNSWVFLLTFLQDRPDINYPFYRSDFTEHKRAGIAYTNKITRTHKGRKIRLHDCCNLSIDMSLKERRIEKERIKGFADFEAYTSYLQQTVSSVLANAKDKRRKKPFEPITMISKGYDSTLVSALASKAGCNRAVTFHTTKDKRKNEEDDGSQIAKALGLEVKSYNNEAYKQMDVLAEAEFYASIGAPHSWSRLKVMEKDLEGSILLAGNANRFLEHKKPNPPLLQSHHPLVLVAGSINEFRLATGFLFFPPIYSGAINSHDIYRITHSRDLSNFWIPGDYNKPIARRFVEDAGIERSEFGQKKYGSAVVPHLVNRLSQSSRESFEMFCKQHNLKESKMNPISYIINRVMVAFIERILKRVAPIWVIEFFQPGLIRFYHLPAKRKIKLKEYGFHWGFECIKNRYALDNISKA